MKGETVLDCVTLSVPLQVSRIPGIGLPNVMVTPTNFQNALSEVVSFALRTIDEVDILRQEIK